MTEAERQAFDLAEVYGGNHDELLSCTEPETYIEELFGLDDETWEEDMRPVTVVAYKRKVIDPVDVEHTVTGIVELMTERYDDDYGEPGADTALKMATDGDLHNRIRAIVREYWATATVWQYEGVARREYSIDEVRCILRNSDPFCKTCGHAESFHRAQIDGSQCGADCKCYRTVARAPKGVL